MAAPNDQSTQSYRVGFYCLMVIKDCKYYISLKYLWDFLYAVCYGSHCPPPIPKRKDICHFADRKGRHGDAEQTRLMSDMKSAPEREDLAWLCKPQASAQYFLVLLVPERAAEGLDGSPR